MKLSDMAVKLGLKYAGNPEREISRVSSPEGSDEGSICAVWDRGVLSKLPQSTAVMMKEELFGLYPSREGIISENPRLNLPELLGLFEPAERPKGIDLSAVISPDAEVSPNAYVGANAYIGCGVDVLKSSLTLKSDSVRCVMSLSTIL